jgi:predicted metal-dependent hydrolase
MPMPESDWAPHPYQLTWPRYSTRPFPPYRFIPGKAPHPRRHPDGHSYGQIEPKPETLHPEAWAESDTYRYGIDLYNFAYWWECHEVFEGFWHAVGRKTEQGQFFQALIHLAAANLKRFTRHQNAAENLLRTSHRKFYGIPLFYMGLDIADLMNRLGAQIATEQAPPILLALRPTDRHPHI